MSVKLPVYLDFNATTPVDERVFEAMRPYFCEMFGNAASRSHSFGWEAAKAVDRGRQQAASIINADADAIIFTSGSTEANNLAIKGVACARKHEGRHIITQATEHKAVLDPCHTLEKDGYDVTVLPVDRRGQIDLGQLKQAIRKDTILVSIMWANNEIGTIYPIRQIAQLCRERGITFHTDATQAVGKIPVDVEADCIDLLSFSAHKLYGPKGCGALFVRHAPTKVDLSCQLDGGGHEHGYRSGTLNVPGIVGLGMACEIASQRMPTDTPRLLVLRDRLEHGLMDRLEGVHINGDPTSRVAHTSNLSFEGITEPIVSFMEDIAVSSGSACTSANASPSHVLRACHIPDELALASLRFSLGRSTTQEEIDHAIDRTVECITNLRSLASMMNGALNLAK